MGMIPGFRDWYIGPFEKKIGEGHYEAEATDNTQEWHNCVFIQNYIFNSSSAFSCGLCNLFAVIQGCSISSISVAVLLLNDSIISNAFLRYIAEFIFLFIFFSPPGRLRGMVSLGGICSKVKGI